MQIPLKDQKKVVLLHFLTQYSYKRIDKIVIDGGWISEERRTIEMATRVGLVSVVVAPERIIKIQIERKRINKKKMRIKVAVLANIVEATMCWC